MLPLYYLLPLAVANRYLPPNLLYGSALRWVGVERVMVFYKDADCFNRLPDVFKLSVDVFLERQTLNKNRGGALWSGADGPWPGAGRSATWRRG
jgi:hypothetical protein